MDRREIKTKVAAGTNYCKSSDLDKVVRADNKDIHDLVLFICGFCMSLSVISCVYWKGRDSHDYYICWLMVEAPSQMVAGCQKLECLWCVCLKPKLFLNLLSVTKDTWVTGPLIQLSLPIVLF